MSLADEPTDYRAMRERLYVKIDLRDKLYRKIEVVDGPLDSPCWRWLGPKNGYGYGKLNHRQERHLAHRFRG
jgi:hypothetical protein